MTQQSRKFPFLGIFRPPQLSTEKWMERAAFCTHFYPLKVQHYKRSLLLSIILIQGHKAYSNTTYIVPPPNILIWEIFSQFKVQENRKEFVIPNLLNQNLQKEEFLLPEGYHKIKNPDKVMCVWSKTADSKNTS